MLSCFFQKNSKIDVNETRKVYLSRESLADDISVLTNFPSNKITTSKYTVCNFIFKNLYQQFRRVANFYFLCIAVVQLSVHSPVSPITSLAPLTFVVVITAVKQGYEDWRRHKSDNFVNSAPTTVCRFGQFSVITSEEIKVGDVVKVQSDEEAPCDLVLLSCSSPDGKCQITTANLDGETNLKVHKCPEIASIYNPLVDYDKMCAVIECDLPNPGLYKFEGKITVILPCGEERMFTLDFINLFPKGASLKNTEFIYGCAIYTGKDTKMILNHKISSNKFSVVEKTLNKFLAVFIMILLIASTVGTVLLKYYNESHFVKPAWYIPPEMHDHGIFLIVNDFFTFIILLNYIIPISLYVTLEMVKFIGSQFFAWDLELYDEETSEPAICNTSDLNEDLGQVQHLFSDKTGTLTENEMIFRQCYINGVQYEDCNGKLSLIPNEGGPCDPATVEHFLLVLALCNDVQIQSSAHDILEHFNQGSTSVKYVASSPDEKALVEACAKFGTVLIEVTPHQCKIKTSSGIKIYKKLCILEFNSNRKRMSTIIEDDEGGITLYCKGADSAVLNLSCDDTTHIEAQVEKYSQVGLRTLVIAERSLCFKEFNEFQKRLNEAQCAMLNRQELVSDVFNTIEKGMDVIGITAVEDHLQEGVPHTLHALFAAGIKVWILTGDHHKTALNISYSCGHIKEGAIKYSVIKQVNSSNCHFALREIQSRMACDPSQSYALITDGESLVFALNDHLELLRDVSEQCSAILCCRLSPLQKAQVVKMIRNSAGSPITAAIGDGANDVSMIQEAHVGLAIIGKEGRQAAMCSDFAFGKFRFLERVLLIHGQYYYIRAAILIQYFFYKNMVFVLPEFIYIFFNGCTPQTVYDNAFLMLYNIVFTSLPIFVFGCTEKHKSEESLFRNPASYRSISQNQYLTFAQFAKWVLQGCWHSFVFYFGTYFLWHDAAAFSKPSLTYGLWSFGTVLFHIVVVTVNLKLALHTKYWTKYFTVALFVTIAGFCGFTVLYTQVYWSADSSILFGVYDMIYSSVLIWCLTLLLIVVALLPDIIIILLEYYELSFKKVTAHHAHESSENTPLLC